jgi:pyrrolysine biosynthesis protein PylD
MTRLREEDVAQIPERLEGYDRRLKQVTGASLRQIACRGAGIHEAQIVEALHRVRFAAVPVRSGLGVIGGFSGAVAAIVSHLGFESFVTESCDAAGIAEGIERGAEILMLADDDRFVAVTPRRRLLADNSQATAQGFLAALEFLIGELTGEDVLVLGCGPVGVAAARALLDRGASVALCDLRESRVNTALRDIGGEAPGRVRIEGFRQIALQEYDLIFDATDAGGVIEPDHLTPSTFVAAPGMPCGLTPEALAGARDRVLHDALEIGTATMAIQAAVKLSRSPEAQKAAEG